MDEKPSTSEEKNNSPNKRKFKGSQRGSDKYKRFAGSKKEGQGFADLRKKQAAKEYLKFLQKEKEQTPSGPGASKKPPLKIFEILARSDKKPGKEHRFSRVQRIADEKKKQKQEEKEKFLKEKEAKDTAIKAYKTKKKEKFLKLCKKTRKGQPVMKNQMEVLLEKIMKHKGMDTKKPGEG